jgi:hypothetical protein
MRFIFKEKTPNVKSFDLFKGRLYYQTNDLEISNLPNFDILSLDIKYTGEIFIIQHVLIWQDYRGKAVIYDLKKSALVFSNIHEGENCTFRRVDLTSLGLLMAIRRLDGKKQICLFDLDNKTFSEINLDINHSVKSGIILLNSNGIEIKRISITGDLLWIFAIEGEYKDMRGESCKSKEQNILGLYGSVLWLALSSGELVGLENNTGVLENVIGFQESSLPEYPYKVKEGDYIPFGEQMQLDSQQGEIIGLGDNFFIKVDLKEEPFQREYIDVSQSMKAHHMSASYRNYSYPIDENYIYFCDDRSGKIGVFDRNKQEVVWSYELEMERGGIAQILEMKYSEGYWYVLDRNDTLHVFERI